MLSPDDAVARLSEFFSASPTRPPESPYAPLRPLMFHTRRSGRRLTVSSSFGLVEVSTTVSTSIGFSVGNPDESHGFDTPIPCEGLAVTVYGRDDDYVSPASWLVDEGAIRLLATLELEKRESLTVVLNDASCRFVPRSVADDPSRIDAFLALVEHLPAPAKKVRVVVPQSFADLQATADAWGITDDESRTSKIERASDAKLQSLVRVILPRLDSLQEYLDAEGEPLSDGAIVLQAAAEAALEAKLELERRGKR